MTKQSAVMHKSSHGVDICETHPVFDKLGFQPKIDQTFDSDEIAVQSLTHSDRWSFLPDLVVQAHKEKLAVIKLPKSDIPAIYSISAVTHIARASDPVMVEVLALIKSISMQKLTIN